MEKNDEIKYHKVLERQIRKSFGKGAAIPPEFVALLQVISDTYKQYEDDRYLIEHTMDVSSQELTSTNQQLLERKMALQIAYEQLQAAQEQLEETEKVVRMSKDLAAAYSLLENQTMALQQAHVNHNAAIQRAKRIQSALLPDRQKVTASFREFFLFYAPLDVVSGDFYWYSEVNEVKMFIVADCTGHGVPGAFMTIMGSALLEEIINTNENTSPEIILELLDKKITTSLMQGQDSTHDGMDISIIAIDNNLQTLTFAAAKQILYQVKTTGLEKQLIEIKGSMFEIGGQISRLQKKYTNTVINYQENDSFYMTTDGYQSQFSVKREKFMRKRLKETIMQFNHLTMIEQRGKFKFTFADWKGDAKQTDDILVVGFRI